MGKREFVVTAWNNGSHHESGAGYGLKIAATDRDAHFKQDWHSVDVYLPGHEQPIKLNIDKASFWNNSCRELISKEIGAWLIANRMAPWPKGQPPRLKLIARASGVFDVAAP